MSTRNVTNSAFTSYPATMTTLPSGRQLTHAYDAIYRRGQVKETSGGANIASWQFFGPSRVAEVTLGNGLICSWMNNARTHGAVQPAVANPGWGNQSSDRLGYDGAGRPITKRYLAGGINGTTHAYSNPSSVVGFTTEYDLASNKFYERELHCESRSHLYEPSTNGSPAGGYDSLDRLRQYQRGALSSTGGFGGNGGGSIATAIGLPNTDTQRTYDLDGLGNWRRTTFTPEWGGLQTEVRQHNGLNEITRLQNGATQTNLSYDGVPGHSNGNLKNDGVRSYIWDALNRLVQVNRVSDGAVIGQYVYDALNRRVRKTVSNGGLTGDIPNGATDCIYAGWRCVEERNPFGGGGSTDTPTAQYIWGIYLDECLQQRLLVGINGFSANSDLYPLQDLLYRTTGLADSSGTVREAYDTDAYGNTLVFRNAGSPPAATAWSDSDTQVHNPTCPFIFTGQRFDAETGNHYFKRRQYGSAIGRFLSRDPVGVATDVNLYRFVRASPPGFVDPFGLVCCGPDVTIWFGNEVALFQRMALGFKVLEAWALYGQPAIGGIRQDLGTGLDVAKWKLAEFKTLAWLGRKADYKMRTFSSPGCKNACPDTVTLCGKCIATNQLGNIMFGVVANDLGLVDEARNYGRGQIPWYYKSFGHTGPSAPWTAPGQQFKETAFDIGVQFAKTGGGCGLMAINNATAPVDTGTANCAPCQAAFDGPQTNMETEPLVDEAGNKPRGR